MRTTLAWIGMVLVDPDYRRQGMATPATAPVSHLVLGCIVYAFRCAHPFGTHQFDVVSDLTVPVEA